MTDVALELVTGYGWIILFLATFFSCLCVPVPSSFVMLAGGAFASTGDLGVSEVVLAAFAGAVLGDNTGFWLGRQAVDRVDLVNMNPDTVDIQRHRHIGREYAQDRVGKLCRFCIKIPRGSPGGKPIHCETI